MKKITQLAAITITVTLNNVELTGQNFDLWLVIVILLGSLSVAIAVKQHTPNFGKLGIHKDVNFINLIGNMTLNLTASFFVASAIV